MRFSVVPCITGAEVFDGKAGRPVERCESVKKAELIAARYNRVGLPRRNAEL